MHIDFVLPENGSIERGLAAYRNKAALGCMDFAFHVAVTSWSKAVAADMARAVDQGINSFKFFLAYKVCSSSILNSEAVLEHHIVPLPDLVVMS